MFMLDASVVAFPVSIEGLRPPAPEVAAAIALLGDHNGRPIIQTWVDVSGESFGQPWLFCVGN
jgi:hypothetical protein